MLGAVRRAFSLAACTKIRRSSALRSKPVEGCSALRRPAVRRSSLARDREVVAVDLNPAQLAYAARRIAGTPMVRGTAEHVMRVGRALLPLAGWRASTLRTFLDLDDPAMQYDFWKAHLDTRRFRVGLDTLLSVASLRTVYAPRLLGGTPPSLRGGHARAHGALLRPSSEPDESLGPGVLRRRCDERTAPPEAKSNQARASRRRRVPRAGTAAKLRCLHAFQHPRRRRRRAIADGSPRCWPRGGAGRDRRAEELRRASEYPAVEPCG